MRALLIVLACATTPVTTWAEGDASGLGDYYVTTWSEKDGLPPASIRALEQGADGDLWLGTETGLVRFDGLRFVPFERLQHGRLPTGAVSALLRAKDGSLWVGLNGPTSLARVRDGRVTTFGESEGIPDGQITSPVRVRERFDLGGLGRRLVPVRRPPLVSRRAPRVGS